jgi:DNA-binding LacI/PurR family transcriptional regulator
MKRKGLEPIAVQSGFTEKAGAQAAAELLEIDPLPTAVFAANDIAAMGVTEVLEDAGLHIPEDISLVGYDNVDFTALDHIGLTTIDQPRRAIGTMAVEMLLERLDGHRTRRRRVTLEPRLIERATTGPPRQ